MIVTAVRIRRFKQLKDAVVELHGGMTVIAGGNNAGKSTLLQALAVWEFCKVATIAQRGSAGLTTARPSNQGFGLGDDEFSPINVPSLKHLWSNMKSQKTEEDADGYTLHIECEWEVDGAKKTLGFGLALANDRLFIKVSQSNLTATDAVPVIAYLPPFAGISAREERIRGALRRRRIGEGLAGAVLRNLLLDMRDSNSKERIRLRGERPKIRDADLKRLREQDPWEVLQQTLREVFGAEMSVNDFDEEYHTYIQAYVVKGDVDKYQLTRYPGYTPRDLMVEGSGFLQWLSVYTLATSPVADLLLFDEPDAHLHTSLQAQLVERLTLLAAQYGKQVLLATHSIEIIRDSPADRILEVRNGGSFKYLSEDEQKIGLLVGIGSSYAPRIDRARSTKRVFFYEGSTDLAVLKAITTTLGKIWPTGFSEWQTSAPHKERKALWRALKSEFGDDLAALSLRDRDDESKRSVGPDLEDNQDGGPDTGFMARKWRRRYIESYLIWPAAIASASGHSQPSVELILAKEFGLAIGPTFTQLDAPDAYGDVRAKSILDWFAVSATVLAQHMPVDGICDDLIMLVDQVQEFGGRSPVVNENDQLQRSRSVAEGQGVHEGC